jgi:hypothetical protein
MPLNSFKTEDIGKTVIILDISEEDGGAYKVQSPKGITALRKNAFKLIKKATTLPTNQTKKDDVLSPKSKVKNKLLDMIKVRNSTPTKV